MSSFLEAVVATLLIPFLLGYPLACALRIGQGLRRLACSGVLGLAVLIVILRSVQYIAGIADVAWWLGALFMAAIVLGWSRRDTRRSIRRDLVSSGAVGTALLGLCVVALIVALNLPIVLHHAIAFEGTGNNDSILYVLNARWMQHHRFFDARSISPGAPLQELTRAFFGWRVEYGRVGGESLLSFVSLLIGEDPVYAYNAVLSAGVAWAAIASLMILPVESWRSRHNGLRQGWLLLPFFCTPALMFIVFNSNYASAFGILFFTAYVIVSLGPTRSCRHGVAAVLLLGALAASYPELIPIAWLSLGLILLARLGLRDFTLRAAVRAGVWIAVEAAICVVVFFWLTLSAWFVIAHAHLSFDTQANLWPDAYAKLPPLRYIVGLLTMSRPFAEWLPSPLCALALIALAWLVSRAFWTSPARRDLLLGAGAAFVLLLAWMFLKPYHYGKLKIVEYFALFAAPVSVLGSGLVQRAKASALPRAFGAVALAVSFLFALGADFFLVRNGVIVGDRKYVSQDMIDLSEVVAALPPGTAVAIGPTRSPFYYSMWFPYLDPHTPMLFNADNGGGGYLTAYARKHPYASYESADYRIEGAGDTPLPPAPAPERVVAAFGDFRLVGNLIEPNLAVHGAYGQEHGFRWLGQTVSFVVHSDAGRFLDVTLDGRYRANQSTEPVTINQTGRSCVIQIDTRKTAISIPLAGPAVHEVSLKFALPALSPAQFGSSDTRKLTYRMTEASLSDHPAHPVVACAGGAPSRHG